MPRRDSPQEGDTRWSANGRVLTREGQQAGLPIDAKCGDLVTALIARI